MRQVYLHMLSSLSNSWFLVTNSLTHSLLSLLYRQVSNNWWPGEVLGAPLYPDGTLADDLAANSRQSFYEFNPILAEKIYRSQKFGQHLEIFFPDMRSYRAPNTDNELNQMVAMMGEEQATWLMDSLAASTATWKILSMHDPISIVTGGPGDYDSFGQNNCSLLGRENELKNLFALIKDQGIENVVSITSDVHYTASITYNPNDSCSGEPNFDSFYEFVIGPIHAGSL